MDFIKKNATIFAELNLYLDDKSVITDKRCSRQWKKKALTILREYFLSKRKPNVISLYKELTSLRRLESESITEYIIRTKNISNASKETEEVISDGLLITMVLKRVTSES